MIDDLAIAIRNRYGSDAGAALRAVLTGSLWFTKSQQVVVKPYATFSWTGSSTEEYMGSGTTSKIEKAEIVFRIFDKSNDGGTTLASIISLLMELFDWADLTIPDHTAVAFERTGTASVEFIDDIWIGTVNYMAWFDG